jgi:hypothetical protein
MAEIFHSTRGCVYTVNEHSGHGLYKLSPEPSFGSGAPAVLMSVDLRDGDIVLVAPTLSNRKVVYTFGEDVGDVTVMWWLLLGSRNEGRKNLTNFVKWFNSVRVARSGKLVKVSVVNKAYKVALTTLRIMEGQGNLNIQPVAAGGNIIEPPK